MLTQTNPQRWRDVNIIKSKLVPLWRLYIGEFFHNDKNLWNGKKEPYIFYKHLFRQFINQKLSKKQRIRDFEEKVCGIRPHYDTIYHSLDKDPNHFKLTQKELTNCLTFLNKYYNVNLGQHLKTKIIKAKNMGYTTDDIARHCRVHKEVITDVLNDKQISYNNIKQIEEELSN